MEPKLAPKSMKNGFQEALNKKDEKWSEKSHAGAREGVPGCAEKGGRLPINNQSKPPGGPYGASGTPLRARGTVADIYIYIYIHIYETDHDIPNLR